MVTEAMAARSFDLIRRTLTDVFAPALSHERGI